MALHMSVTRSLCFLAYSALVQTTGIHIRALSTSSKTVWYRSVSENFLVYMDVHHCLCLARWSQHFEWGQSVRLMLLCNSSIPPLSHCKSWIINILHLVTV